MSCDTAMNLIVLKTLPGLASAASSAMDGMEHARARRHRRRGRHGVPSHARREERRAVLRGDKKAVLRGKEAGGYADESSTLENIAVIERADIEPGAGA